MVNRVALCALLSLTLPPVVAGTSLQVMTPAIKPSKAPPMPDEELRVPLLGLDRSSRSADAASTCSLSQCDPQSCPLGPNRACLLQTFEDIEWRLCVYSSQFGTVSGQSNKGLEIGQVYLRRLFVPNDPWRLILYRAGLADLFTVYHRRGLGIVAGDDYGFYETQYLNDWGLGRRTVTQADAGPNGTLITLAQDASFGPTVVAECRDRGLAWLCKQNTNTVRRGQELVIWALLDTGNYDFVTEYGFRDDGTITMRVGATGYNNPIRPAEAHIHDGLWRIDIDLNGSSGDSAYLTEHKEPDDSPLRAADLETRLDVEGSATWDPQRFTSLLVEDAAVNAHGEHLGYELEPLRSGIGRHYGDQVGNQEKWAHQDFWVTRWHSTEDTAWAVPWKNPDAYLLPYIGNAESLVGQDLVLWYYDTAHHHPTDEDRDGQGNFAVTLMHWYGLELHPHNFFDRNPLGAPEACGN